MSSGQEIKRHLITAQTSIEFNAERGIITVSAAGEGARIRLEQDMLEAGERPNISIQQKIENDLHTVADDVWTSPVIEGSIKSWINSLGDGDGEYDHELKCSDNFSHIPRMLYAPALLLRKRSEQGFVEVYKKILTQIEEGGDLPRSIIPLVVLGKGQTQQEPSGTGTPQKPKSPNLTNASELYFPLPANDEQEQIVKKLGNNPGIIVQGPPGTGKSHTIANLVCHLLASGKRVLVTSHKAGALRVLKDKIPKEVTALAVILLGNDRASLMELEESVNGITQRLNHWSDRQHQQRLQTLERELDQCRRELARTETELRRLREGDVATHSLPFGGYEGTYRAIASQLKDQEATYQWIKPIVAKSADLSQPLYITGREALDLAEIYQAIDPVRENELQESIPPLNCLMEASQFEVLVYKETDALTVLKDAPPCHEFDTSRLEDHANEELDRYAELVDQVVTRYREIVSRVFNWTQQLADDVIADQDRACNCGDAIRTGGRRSCSRRESL